MKSLKVVLASLFLTVGVIAFSSFISDSYNSRAFAKVCYTYVGVIPATAASLAADASWQLLSPAPSDEDANTICPERLDPCIICFDNTAGGTFTKAEAISLVSQYFTTNGNFNSLSDPGLIQHATVPAKQVTLYQKER